MALKAAVHTSYSPSEVRSGPGAQGEVGQLLKSWTVAHGATVVLVVDPDVHQLGLTTPIRQSLETEDFRVVTVACERGEPKLPWVQDVVATVRRAQPAACVGVGGGSAMDIAKLAAALVRNAGEVTDFLGLGKVRKQSIPTVMIPTTAGTGSETTQVSMLATAGKKVVVASAPLVPRGAILDPELTVGLPMGVTVASGLDALSHGIESYLSTRANVSTMGASLHGAQLVASSIRDAVHDPHDVDHRLGMLGGAFWSGIGLNASVVLGHSMAYTIANRTGLAHGVTCAMALPYCMAYNERASHERIQRLTGALREHIEAGEEPSGKTPTIYTWLDSLCSRLGIPQSLASIGITEKDLPQMIDECVESYPRPNNPVPFDEATLSDLYRYMLEGDLAGCLKAFGTN